MSDVLIIGGGMAAAWAAIAAAEAGAHVTVVDKGVMGTSGVTATGGPGHWWVPPDPALRGEAIARQHAKAAGLGDPAWMERILDLTWRHLPTIAPYYPFGSDGHGGRFINGVRGPEYMRALRHFALARGVRILDHHPALELLADGDGRVIGARGVALRDESEWSLRAGAVVLATGGAAFRSGLIGAHACTGDGHLMAVEAGARLSGMEFSLSWSLSPEWASTRTLPYTGARFYDDRGNELDIAPPRTGHRHYQALGAAMLAGPVWADLVDAPAELHGVLRRIQPLTVAAFERRGINIFRDRFRVKLFGEGTIRGTGGVDLVDGECRTGEPGLFAAGDTATRELVAGASSGGGAVNSAWALSSGRIAGAAAAAEALASHPGDTPARALGQAALRPSSDVRAVDAAGLIARAGAAVHDYDQALWRTGEKLGHGARALDADWAAIAAHGHARGRAQVELRSAAAVVATARWVVAAARDRAETRGLHVRVDAPETDPAQARRQLTGGLDRVWTRPFEPALEVAA